MFHVQVEEAKRIQRMGQFQNERECISNWGFSVSPVSQIWLYKEEKLSGWRRRYLFRLKTTFQKGWGYSRIVQGYDQALFSGLGLKKTNFQYNLNFNITATLWLPRLRECFFLCWLLSMELDHLQNRDNWDQTSHIFTEEAAHLWTDGAHLQTSELFSLHLTYPQLQLMHANIFYSICLFSCETVILPAWWIPCWRKWMHPSL